VGGGYRAHGQMVIERGESREAASLRAAYYKLFEAAPNDFVKLWVIKVVEARWPELIVSSRSAGSSSTRALASG
jgi:hypothetical protein